MRYILTAFALFLTFSAHATMTVGQVECGQEFEGKVQSISKFVDEKTHIPLQKVEFKDVSALKGEVEETLQLEMLESGPFKVQEGEEYRVQLNNGKLCWIEKV